ncbi:MAG: hypothetical protein NZ959_02705 [Armatimonadetes bacterium]|nr:hypothetical protein [Armatimonadota bacterium]MDW8121510.1 hypothetical protein [Armatimonadota bacterium]
MQKEIPVWLAVVVIVVVVVIAGLIYIRAGSRQEGGVGGQPQMATAAPPGAGMIRPQQPPQTPQ